MQNSTFGEKVLDFYRNLTAPKNLPSGIETMNPYETPEVREYVERFLKKYFSDNRERVFVLGINPGRFGSGVTGVTFTDPVALEKFCGINNTLEKRREISSEFIYEFIQQWGGPERFYQHFFLTAVSPLGFVRDGINYNYYDDQTILAASRSFIVQTLHSQLLIGARRDVAILLGTGKNQKIFNDLNEYYGFFKKVDTLEHPRFIMQYRRRTLAKYLQKYYQVFTQAIT
jgi:uracil DNA glycosylase superfamily protein